ncbi:MAG: MmgE/PrpD family protein [Candidatus Kaistia colombiensis]|nr:MAG: MmgE/PrpD family protein [Kaistia sp.]
MTERLVGLLARPISAADRQRAALHVVDWIGCAAIGRTTESGIRIEAEAPASDAGPAQLFGARSSDPATAAFVLGGFGSILEMDDVHRAALLHPGPIVIPAALAAARDDTRAEDFLDAVIRGYEAMIRLGSAVGPGHYAFFHNTATCGGFGAAAAAGSLLGLDEAALAAALGNAGSVAGGLWQCRNEAVMTKTLHLAEAARRGLVAARLAAHGFTGPRFILEGPQGFFAATCPGASPNDVVAGPESGWKIAETSFKPWPACRHAHAAIDAALALRDKIADRPIAGIDIETYADAKLFCDRPAPETVLQAKFSLQHAVAVTLSDGPPPLAAFDLPALGRPDLAALREVATVAASARFTAPYPRHFGSAVAVRLTSGETLSHSVADAWGDTENPVSDAALLAKAHALMQAAGLGRAQAEALVHSALSLAEGGTLAPFRNAMAKAA